MALNSVKTLNFALLEQVRDLNQPFSVLQYSTLNEAFNIGNIAPPSSGYPTMQYLAIGRGGHSNVVGTGNDTLTDILTHRSTDTTMFQAIPFVMVPTSADLGPTARAKYRIRVLETYGGIDYYCYYLKVIPETNITTDVRVIQVTNGVITSDVAYVPSITSLSPTPINISNTVVNVANGEHLVAQSVLPITLDSTDILNIINACVTKYGDARYATISELGVVSAYDVSVTNTMGGHSTTYTEVQAAQIMAFVGTYNPCQNNPDGITQSFALSSTLLYPSV